MRGCPLFFFFFFFLAVVVVVALLLGVLARAHLLLSRFACAYPSSSKKVMCTLEAIISVWCLLEWLLGTDVLEALSRHAAVSACQWTNRLVCFH